MEINKTLEDTINYVDEIVVEALQFEDYDEALAYLNRNLNTIRINYNPINDIEFAKSKFKTEYLATGLVPIGFAYSNIIDDYFSHTNYKDFARVVNDLEFYSYKILNQITDISHFKSTYDKITNLQISGEISWADAVRQFRSSNDISYITFSNGSRYPANAYYKMIVSNYQRDLTQIASQKLASNLGTDVYQYGSITTSSSRDGCIEMESQFFTFGEAKTITNLKGNTIDVVDIFNYGYGDAGGPQGCNCVHSYYPVVSGNFI